jgi:hypothetical protein
MDLAIEYRPTGAVLPALANPKRHSLPELRASYRRFGFAESIIEDGRTGRLVAGHGRLETLVAMQLDGEDAPGGIRVNGLDWLVPVQVGWASKDDAEALAFLLAANRLSETGGWDQAGVTEALSEITRTSALGLEGTGYDQDAYDDLLSQAGALPTTDQEPFQGGFAESLAETERRRNTGVAMASQGFKEIILVLHADQLPAFQATVGACQKEWGTDSTTATVVEALRRAGAALAT